MARACVKFLLFISARACGVILHTAYLRTISGKRSFYMHHPPDRRLYTLTFVNTSRGGMAGMRNSLIAHDGSIR